MIPFDSALNDTLAKLGLAEPALMAEVTTEWAQVAGQPWADSARPVYLRQGTLVVEAHRRGGVALLRYGVTELVRRLGERFGDAIQDVEVKPPSRGLNQASGEAR